MGFPRTRGGHFAVRAVAAAMAGGPLAAPARADNLPPLTITREAELRFGRLVVVAGSAQVTVPNQGLPAYSGAVPLSGSTGPARFVVRGQPGKQVDILFAEQLGGSFGAGGRAQLDGLTIVADSTPGFERHPGTVRVKLDAGGVNAITIGGKLSLTANASSGPLNIPIPLAAAYRKGN